MNRHLVTAFFPICTICRRGFRIFILMASRRLNSDRFFTESFTEKVYTREGMSWINDNTMITVLLRHCPQLLPYLTGLDNAFAIWNRDAGGG